MDVITATQLMPILARLMDGALEGVGSQMWESLVRLVKHRQRKAPELVAAVEAVSDHPTDQALLNSLATSLASHSRSDAEFGRQLQEWYATASKAADGQTINVISGTVEGPAVQARDIHGGIRFGKN
jgi:hypothetical protein